MAARKDQINLLPGLGFEATTTGRILAWLLSTFRVIVIITEIIVMAAFISRFWFDTKVTDLSDEIKEKTAILSSYSNFEKEFKDTQTRLKIFSDFTKDEDMLPKTLNTITSFLPTDLFLTSLSLSENSLELLGSTPNERSIQQFITNLYSTEQFEEINIVDLQSNIKTENLLDFKITAKLKK